MISLILGICFALIIGIGFFYYDKVGKYMTISDVKRFMTLLCWLSFWAGMLMFNGMMEVVQ